MPAPATAAPPSSSVLCGGVPAAAYLQERHPKDPAWNKGLLLKLAKADCLPHVKVGRHFFFRLDALDAWMAAGGQRYPGGWRLNADGPPTGRPKGKAPKARRSA
jgi:hypothetical protein